MKEKMCQVIEDWGRNVRYLPADAYPRSTGTQVLLATGEVPELPDDEEGGSLEILRPTPPAEVADGVSDAKGKGKGDDKKKDKKKDKGDGDEGQQGLTSAFVPSIRSVCFARLDFYL
jgi:hypothetical protein